MLYIFFGTSVILSLIIFFAKNKRLNLIIFSIFAVLVAFLTVYSYINLGKEYSSFYKFDSIGVLFTAVLSILTFATFYHSTVYLKHHIFNRRQESIYYSALIMLIAAMISVYFTQDIAVQWVSIEATTLFVSFLIYHERTEAAIEAAWKYLFVSSVGVALAFIGILFISIVANKSGLSNLNFENLMVVANSVNPLWLKIAFVMVVTGYSAKMGVFPLHTVTVDAHTVAPPPISAFISTTLMNVGFLGIFRVFTIISHTSVLNWAKNLLIIVGVLSLFMSAIQLLRIKHVKRMFAFSSLEHMGIVALGLAVGGIGYYAAILHIVFHSFAKASLFYQVDQAHSIYKSYWLKNFGSYLKLNPLGAVSFIFGFISILAIPPSGLFISEFLTFKAMFLSNNILVGVISLFLLTIIMYAFGSNAFKIIYGEKPKNFEPQTLKINRIETVSQFVLLALVVYLGFAQPDILKNLINSTIAILN